MIQRHKTDKWRHKILMMLHYKCTEVGGAKDEKRKILAKPNNFGTKIFLMF